MKFIRPEIMFLISQISGGFKYNSSYKLSRPKVSIFDYFEYGGDIYKEKFISHFNGIQHKDDYFFSPEEFDKFKPKVGGIFTDRNSFNLFYIMYKKAKSLNKYGIKKFLFKEYISSDELEDEKIIKLRQAIIDFYTNEEDIDKYTFGSSEFIFDGYTDEELDILYNMGLFIKDDNIEGEIFKKSNGLRLVDIILSNNGNSEYIGKGEIFANEKVYNYFLYFYNNSKSFQKLYTRSNLIRDFLSKDKIGLTSAIKNIGILINYVKSLDELLSTPYCDLLDDLVKLDEICKKYDEELSDDRNSYLAGDRNEEFDKNDDRIHSDIELKILSIFYDIDRINGYTYYDDNEFIDSDYLDSNDLKNKDGNGFSNLDLVDFYK
ncbi:MAG: hypothetical protein PHV23_05250 [Candidatus Gracilibacteria bacterium]|nr:hypothetical protein [Candidatus Gracilibacteria bacterium]